MKSRLLRLIGECDRRNMDAYAALLREETGVPVSAKDVERAMRGCNIARKLRTHRNNFANLDHQLAFCQGMYTKYKWKGFLFSDECSADRKLGIQACALQSQQPALLDRIVL